MLLLHFHRAVGVILLTLLFSLSWSDTSAASLRLGVHPYLSAIELNHRFLPLCDYLSQQSHQPVSLVVTSTFNDLLDQLLAGKLDLAYMGSSNYTLLAQRGQKVSLLGQLRGEKQNLRGAIVVRHDSPIAQISDLRGKRMAFVNPNSTMGYRVTTHVLVNAGIRAADLSSWTFLGNHENVAYAVLAGAYDAGSVKQEILHDPRFQDLRILAPLSEVADHLFIAGPSVAPAQLQRLQQAFLALNDNENGRTILRTIRKDIIGIVPATDQDYDQLRLYEQAIPIFEGRP